MLQHCLSKQTLCRDCGPLEEQFAYFDRSVNVVAPIFGCGSQQFLFLSSAQLVE